MSGIISVLNSSGKTIDFLLVTKDEAYHLSWPTAIADEQAFTEIREFYEVLRRNFCDKPREIPGKAYHGLILFGRNGPSPEMSLEEFLNEGEFQQITHGRVLYSTRISTPYGDFFYDMKPSEGQIIDGELVTQRYMAIMSHLDLSEQLPPLIQRTHAVQIVQEDLPRLTQDLQSRLGKYGK